MIVGAAAVVLTAATAKTSRHRRADSMGLAGRPSLSRQNNFCPFRRDAIDRLRSLRLEAASRGPLGWAIAVPLSLTV